MNYNAKFGTQPNEWIVTTTDDDLQRNYRVACKPSNSSASAAIALIQGMQSGDPVVPLETLKVQTGKQVDAFHSDLLTRLTGSASVAEQMTWAIKADAAKAVLASNEGPEQTAMLTPEAAARGISLTDLASVIVGKNTEFHGLVGLAGSLRVKGHGLIAAASDKADLAAVIPQLQADVAAATST